MDMTMGSVNVDTLIPVLVKLQAELPQVKLNAKNPFLGNRYADLTSVIATAKPLLAKYELAISQLVYSDGDRVGVTTILWHKSGQWIGTKIALPIVSNSGGEKKPVSQAQVAGSIITYLRRYSYAAILGMTSEEDTDGRTERNPRSNQPQRSPAPTGSQPSEPPPPAQRTPAPRDEAVLYLVGKRSKVIMQAMKIPYYEGNSKHVVASIAKLYRDGELKAEQTDEEWLGVINAHASLAADKKLHAEAENVH